MERQCYGESGCGGYADYVLERLSDQHDPTLPRNINLCIVCLSTMIEEANGGDQFRVTVLQRRA